ncbi:hypothetical protein M5K25_012595 [Dendrobium thyrsiflorum]|uniref:FLZ-type domain-containing protein n=1 Tax=Dendrobium thyrsiflorum TaxID=117978 RepID=A0ABD0UY46_DENTH
MIPRTSSIFHFEEEEGEGERGNELINGGILSRKTTGKDLVGLQILISEPDQEANNNVVIKSSKKICKKPVMISVDFLKLCFLCSKELSLQKEVYMYRGDQGFCSLECRSKKILQDERREFNASARQRFRLPNHHHMGSKIQESNGRTKITVSA